MDTEKEGMGVGNVSVIFINGEGFEYENDGNVRILAAGYDEKLEMYFVDTSVGITTFPRESVASFFIKPSEQAEVVPLVPLSDQENDI